LPPHLKNPGSAIVCNTRTMDTPRCMSMQMWGIILLRDMGLNLVFLEWLKGWDRATQSWANQPLNKSPDIICHGLCWQFSQLLRICWLDFLFILYYIGFLTLIGAHALSESMLKTLGSISLFEVKASSNRHSMCLERAGCT
jgi:hypothetical protein